MAEDSLAAVFHAAGQPVRLQRFPLPELSAGEALVRVTCCTLCGSDLHTYQGHRPTPIPTILGHEILGEIASLAPGQPVLDQRGQPLGIGQRVTWSVAASCTQCFFCNHGMPQKCEHLFKYGHEQIRDDHALSGGLAEYCHLARGTTILALPEDLPELAACPCNCATATVAAGLRVGGGCREETVLIQGAGMLGLTACAMARARGASQVVVCDVDPRRLRLAEKFGATRCVLVGEQSRQLKTAVQEVTAGRGVDLALELSGASGAVETGLELLRIGGRYVLIGAVFPAPPVPVSAESVVRRWLSIHGVHNYTPTDLADALDFLVRNHDRFPLAELVTDTFTLEESAAAFQHALASRALRVAVLPG